METLCSKNEYTKSESNSQQVPPYVFHRFDCVQRTNIQNLKAIHNVKGKRLYIPLIVFKERIYKIWKLFTTEFHFQRKDFNCVQRTNIQNLKAIHNLWFITLTYAKLCSKNEYTKSESNSQQLWKILRKSSIVFKERIYKIWKQFTTGSTRRRNRRILCSKNEYTKSESNSQRDKAKMIDNFYCVQRTNIQNLKAIHN